MYIYKYVVYTHNICALLYYSIYCWLIEQYHTYIHTYIHIYTHIHSVLIHICYIQITYFTILYTHITLHIHHHNSLTNDDDLEMSLNTVICIHEIKYTLNNSYCIYDKKNSALLRQFIIICNNKKCQGYSRSVVILKIKEQ